MVLGTGVLLAVAGAIVADRQPAPAPVSQTATAPATTERHETPTRVDGILPRGVTVFDERHPGVTKLDPDLLRALRAAGEAARSDGVDLEVTSGWRSPAYQYHLLTEAIAEYGSEAEAARWVATPSTSLHVTGHAVDLGGADAWAWIAEHGSGYGLCRIYRNEPWHVELRPEARSHGCPAAFPDPTHDPRLRG